MEGPSSGLIGDYQHHYLCTIHISRGQLHGPPFTQANEAVGDYLVSWQTAQHTLIDECSSSPDRLFHRARLGTVY